MAYINIHIIVVCGAVVTIFFLSMYVKLYQMKLESLLSGRGGMTNEDREVLRAVQQSILRIENRLEALETLVMDREREEKFGMKL